MRSGRCLACHSTWTLHSNWKDLRWISGKRIEVAEGGMIAGPISGPERGGTPDGAYIASAAVMVWGNMDHVLKACKPSWTARAVRDRSGLSRERESSRRGGYGHKGDYAQAGHGHE